MSDVQESTVSCPGTIDWFCRLKKGHKGDHDPGVIKGATKPFATSMAELNERVKNGG